MSGTTKMSQLVRQARLGTLIVLVLVAVACTAGCESNAPDDPGGGDTNGVGDQPAGWMYTEGNRIYLADGAVFHGRGANLHDTRSCWACAWNDPAPEEVMRRMDTLVDEWGANFIRLTLEAYGEGSEEQSNWATQYGTVIEDPEYLADIKEIVDHAATKPGVVVLLSLWTNPSFSELGWPTEATRDQWRLLARTFADSPHVMFGLVNEPQYNFDRSLDADVWQAMNDTVQAIREEEDLLGTPHHIITVQGTGGWARYLDYYIDHPITAYGGANIAYEVHVYDGQDEFDSRFVTPSQTLPVVIGEFGPAEGYMTMADCSAMMELAEQNEVPYLAWTFHMNCPPNLLETTVSGCGIGAPLRPSEWGQLLIDRLAVLW